MVSIKEGKVIPKKQPDKYAFSIEDPFDLFHNPGKTGKGKLKNSISNHLVDKGGGNYHKIIKAFKETYLSLIQDCHHMCVTLKK